MPDAAAAASAILNPGKEPSPAERAALDYVSERAWVLWHADDHTAAVIRLLAHGGLLRDRARETELHDAGIVMRRLDEEDKTSLKRQLSAALEEIEQLRQELVQSGGVDAR